MPTRHQRKRNKGWKKPPNSVIVDRTSKWGNPFRFANGMILCDASHRRGILDKWVIFEPDQHFTPKEGRNMCITLYSDWLFGILDAKHYENHETVRPCKIDMQDIKKELAGKDLVCFCDLGQRCHADVLLELANDLI